ncbi:MAG TPA: 16S rRNA (uracil(1498)-N(3))-methyltransferase [Thermoanaerobaculia bacterium]|nr:16S rRNA (uracil(1498)-N(3))-methyltransferase [Thermoanaerobaculia bacterium]
MNLILLFDSDFIEAGRVRLSGRRVEHVKSVHRAAVGDTLTVGVMNGRAGTGVVTSLEPLELEVTLDRDPPAPLPLTLILAMPRPKVLNRVIASATSLGVKRIHLINAWRVEKSYWKSPRLSTLDEPCVLGLEQARDTVMPSITLHRLFRPFIESFTPSGRALVAHPGAALECPRDVSGEVTLAIGPEGGFIAEEIASFERAGFMPVSMGPRILRVETAVAALIARLF